MNEVASGGIGAVSGGIAEPLVEVVVLLLVLLALVGGWKLLKVLWAMFG